MRTLRSTSCRPRLRAAAAACSVTFSLAAAALAAPLAGPALAGLPPATPGSPGAGPRLVAPAALPSGPAGIARVQRDLATLGRRIDQAVEDYDNARIALAAAQRRATAATALAEATRRDLAAKRRLLAAFAVSAYQDGAAGKIVAVVDGSPAEYLDRLSAMDVVSRRQADAVTAVQAATRRYDAAQAAATAAVNDATAVTRRLAATKTAIQQQIRSEQQLLGRLRAEQARLQRIAAEKAAAAARAAAARRGQALAAARRAQSAATAVRRITSAAGSSSAPRHSPSAPHSVPASGRAAVAVRAAYSALGRPYAWGAAGPGAFDCSGLTSWAWAQAGVSLPHSSSAQYGAGPHVAKGDLQPGDLVFFYSPISHVGIYVGGGRMIDAPHTGTVVSLRAVLWSDYVGAVRPG